MIADQQTLERNGAERVDLDVENAQDTPAGLLQPLCPRTHQRHLASEDDVDDEIQQRQRHFTGEPENPPGYARWVLQKCSHRFNRSTVPTPCIDCARTSAFRSS